MGVNVELRDALICDDVRFEMSGKLMLIGVYSSEINVDSFPQKIRIKLYVTFRALKSKSKLEFRLVDDGVPQPPFSSVEVEAIRDNQLNLTQGVPITGPLIEVEKRTVLAFEGRVDSGDWVPLSAVLVSALAESTPE
jgi:hypothetical protein